MQRKYLGRVVSKKHNRFIEEFRKDAGTMLVFGSDWQVAPADPLLGIYAAVTRRTLDNKNPDGWIPEQKVTVEEALNQYHGGTPRFRGYASFPFLIRFTSGI